MRSRRIVTDSAMRLRRWLLPTFALLLASLFAQLSGLDAWVEDRLFDPRSLHFLLGRHSTLDSLLHGGGQWLIVATAVMLVLGLLASWRSTRLRPHRGDLAYLLACLALSTGVVAGIKSVSGVDCPIDTDRYGGPHPTIGLADRWRHAALRAGGPGRCFPGGHSSGAFGLLGFAFIAARRDRRQAWRIGAAVAMLGAGFAATQWARGAHFVSHDLASAALAWLICCGLADLRRARLERRQAQDGARSGLVVLDLALPVVQQGHRANE